MFNIDIASLRDPATLSSIKTQVSTAAAIVTAFEEGSKDAESSNAYQTGLSRLMKDMYYQCMAPTSEVHSRLVEAYNLGWDTVRLQRGVNKNAK